MNWVFLCQVLWYGFRNGVVYILFASGLTLIFGVMQVVNFAHGEIYMVGAILVYLFTTLLGLNYFLSIALSITSAALLGFISNRLIIQPLLKHRASQASVMLSTMGLSYMLLHGVIASCGSDVVPVEWPLQRVLHVGGIIITEADLILVLVGAITIGGLYLFLTKAKLGKKMRATSQNTMGAKIVGINTLRVYDYTMIAGITLAAVGGILLAPISAAYAGMGQPMLVLGFAIVIIGGMGNVQGVVITGLVLGLAEALFGYYVSTSYKPAFVYALMIAGLLWRPEGVFYRK